MGRNDKGTKDTKKGDIRGKVKPPFLFTPTHWTEREADPTLIELLRAYQKTKPTPDLDGYLGLKISKSLLEEVSKSVELGHWKSASEFVRDSIMLNLTVEERLRESEKGIEQLAVEVMTEVQRVGAKVFLSEVMAPLLRLLGHLSDETLAQISGLFWTFIASAFAGMSGVSDEMARKRLVELWVELRATSAVGAHDSTWAYNEALWRAIGALMAGVTGVPEKRAIEGVNSLITLLQQEAQGAGTTGSEGA